MRVLFAVNNDNISNAIIKKYQKEYKEILSCKNVYYFNAIIKELQTNRNYDRIVISEDLEPFANNNYDTIDKFLFEKLDKISDEATKANGDTSEIIVICADRRTKSDDMLVKFFSIGIYNALLGQDRSIEELCKLINQPRTKKDAKTYYKIETNNVEYQAENENNVSEAEVQNILAHYKRLGKNEDKYIDSFNNIVSQYTDAQLKLIIPYLPMHVKAVLEEKSPKYQELVTFSVTKKRNNEEYKAKSLKSIKEAQQEEKIKIKMLNSESSKPKMSKPVVIPSTLSGIKSKPKEELKKVDDNSILTKKNDVAEISTQETPISKKERKTVQIPKIDMKERKVQDIEVKPIEVTPLKKTEVIQEENEAKPEVTTEKRGRGRPRKNPVIVEEEQKTKRGRGRPKKQPEKIEEKQEEIDEELDLFGLNDEDFEIGTENKNQEKSEELDLFNLDEELDLFNSDKDLDDEEELDLFNLDDDSDDEKLDLFDLDLDKDSDEEEVDLFNLDEEKDDEELDEEELVEELDLFGLDEDDTEIDEDKESDNKQDDDEIDLFAFNEEDDNDEEVDLFGMNEEIGEKDKIQNQNLFSSNLNINGEEETTRQKEIISNNKQVVANTPVTISKDKKVVSFVGTTKNGTSFVVNNLATILSSMNISTAILDITKSKNAYYIYTNDNEYLRETAANCMAKLEKGIADGIKVNKNLAVYTSLPGEEISYGDIGSILNTLLENHNLVLVDCDFDTPAEFFENSQEIYLVQSMDVLTIQPLTAFLRTLKAKNVLKEEKLRIIINKEQKVRSLSTKTLIGGMANYNDPSMSFMTELFDKNTIPYFKIPFEMQNYVTYLDSLVNCQISFKGYTKQFENVITELAGIIYPLMNKKRNFNPLGRNKKEETLQFSEETNDTLSKMKKNY